MKGLDQFHQSGEEYVIKGVILVFTATGTMHILLIHSFIRFPLVNSKEGINMFLIHVNVLLYIFSSYRNIFVLYYKRDILF